MSDQSIAPVAPPEGDEISTALRCLADDLKTTKDDVRLIITHLVPFLRANQGVADLQSRLDRLERQRAARLERPLIHGIARALAQLRHLGLDPDSLSAVEGELLRALSSVGCAEFDPTGLPLDTARHNVINASPGGNPVVTATHTPGVEVDGEVIVKAGVETGPGR